MKIKLALTPISLKLKASVSDLSNDDREIGD
jgi:hypothetical protein